MRKIKFRGKDKSGEWWYGSLACFPDSQTTHIIPCGTCKGNNVICDFVEVIPDTVGQITGLLDRNGKEIYEGDIIQLDFKTHYPIEFVAFKNGRFVTIDPQRPYRDESLCVFVEYASVLGNIHDTPKLLESGKI